MLIDDSRVALEVSPFMLDTSKFRNATNLQMSLVLLNSMLFTSSSFCSCNWALFGLSVARA